MKPRRVVVTLEVETNLPLFTLRSVVWWQYHSAVSVQQAQANVIRSKAGTARVRRRKRRR